MLAIRMQRTGRKGHAQFRVVVQNSRQTPTSGRVVASLGSYNPHTKEAKLDLDKATTYLTNGAQPSERVAQLLQKEGVKLPDWVQTADKKQKATKHAEKLRKNQPVVEVVEEVVIEEVPTEAAEADAPTEEVVEVVEVVAEEQAPAA